MSNVTYPGKLFPPAPKGSRIAPSCVDCGVDKGPMMCPPCAERLAEDLVEHITNKNDKKPTLKLFEVAIDPMEIPRGGGPGYWRFVMVLSTDDQSAVDSAMDILQLPNGRADLTWNVHECEGPFVKGSILSVKSIPVI